MIETTTDFIPGKKVAKILGVVRGNTIRSRGMGGHIIAGIESAFGGQITAYMKALDEARDEAYSKMMEEAEKLNADAVINIRFATSQVMPQAAEILVYGTAVKLG
ncbi:MAG TPA: YbjQ family protein [archaeon]|nr:YbjQ family protein [archaeon]